MTRILVLDDSKTMRLIAAAILKELPEVSVKTFGDGWKALKEANQAVPRYDIVITDINMPGIDGLSFVKCLRALPGYAETPILAVTTVNAQPLKERAAELGVLAWIRKPVNAAALRHLVQQIEQAS